MDTKLCTKCGKEKPTSFFNKDKSKRDGKHSHCTECKMSYTPASGQAKIYSEYIRKRIEKQCSKCELTKSLDFFYKHKTNPDGYRYECIECAIIESHKRSPEQNQKMYLRNRDIQLLKRANNRKIRKQILCKLVGNQCYDCSLIVGDEWPAACFDFHHKDPMIKEKEISKMLQTTNNEEYIIHEISKCILLCSNCHRRRHALRTCKTKRRLQ